MNETNCSRYRFSLPIILTAALAACARTPVPELESSDVPLDWQGPVQENADVWPNTDWWNNFGMEELVEIIELVKANNFDYQNNLRNLETARLALYEAGLQLLPQPNVDIRTNASTSVQQFAAGSSQGGQSGPFNLSAGVSFGGNVITRPLSHETALIQYESQKANISSTALNTLVTAARTYFQLLINRDTIRQIERNLENARQTLQFTQARVDAGVEIQNNLLNQQISVQSIENQLRSAQQQDFQNRATLALLTGQGVRGFDVEGQTLEGVIVPDVQPGIPSELLTRNPSIVNAEYQLRNAAISVDTARVAFFPSISLSGISGGASSPSLINAITDPVSTTVSLSASLSQQIFNNGQRKRNLRRNRLQLETQLANYRRTVLSTFNSVEVALNNIEEVRLAGEVTALNRELATEQFRLADLRYRQGTTNYQTYLQAENTLFQQRQSVLTNQLQQINALLDFYVLLGGGWEAGDLLLDLPEYQASSN